MTTTPRNCLKTFVTNKAYFIYNCSQESCNIAAWYRGAVEVTERALCAAHGVVLANTAPAQQTSLLRQITELAGNLLKFSSVDSWS